jgi:hypothetical protein
MNREQRSNIWIVFIMGVMFCGFGLDLNERHFQTHTYCTIDSFDERECNDRDTHSNLKLLVTINNGLGRAIIRCGSVINCTSSPCNYNYVKGETYYCDFERGVYTEAYMLYSNMYEADWSKYTNGRILNFMGFMFIVGSLFAMIRTFSQREE